VPGRRSALASPFNIKSYKRLLRKMNFTLPAVVRGGDLTLPVATEVRCPAFARALREELEERYGDIYGEALEFMRRLRDAMLSDSSSTVAGGFGRYFRCNSLK